MTKVLIIGGGYAGSLLARTLDPVLDVVLVEPREAFVHNVGAPRALADPALLNSLILPYDRLLARGTVVRDRAVAIAGTAVTLAGGSRIEGDIVVIATGSRHAPMLKAGDDVAGFAEAVRTTHRQIAAARSIAIVGAGAVGVELAGEIMAAQPGKAVTLVSATPTLFPDFHPALGRRLERDLARIGVMLLAGVAATGIARDAVSTDAVVLSYGRQIMADLVIPALGARAADTLSPGVAHDAIGRVAVDPWLRVPGAAAVFAVGDGAAAGDMMTIVAVSRQVPWLARTISALAKGAQVESLKPYTPWRAPPILIPLGPREGASVLPLGPRGLVVGPTLTRAIKGKTLFVPRYRKEFGLA